MGASESAFLPALPTPTSSGEPSSPASRWREGLHAVYSVLRANPLTLAGAVLVAIIVVTAIVEVLVPLLTQLFLGHSLSILPHDPNFPTSPPRLGPTWAYPLGTDEIGRDMFSRVLAALPLDLVIGFGITGISLLIGGLLGLAAGYWDTPGTLGGIASVTILRITDLFLAFPSLVLALAIAVSLGRGTLSAILAILLTWWPYYVRLVRGEVIAVKHLPFVTAATASGVSSPRILFRHILRNIIDPIAVYYTLDIGSVLVTFSTISFFGIGVPPNVPEWGSMIEFYQPLFVSLPWTVLAPGAAVFVTVIAFSLLGDGLRDLLDPRTRRAYSGIR